jgi:cytochrome c-type biogenesis protein CcmE
VAVTSSPEPVSVPAGALGTARRSEPGRRRLWLAGMVVLAALAVLLVRGLGDATVYFKTVDEAVAQRSQLGDHRFRIEGTVVPGSVRQTGDDVAFRIQGAGGASADVTHRGDPPELFRPGIPVVLEGAWAGDHYASDRIMVRHTSQYQARHPERVSRYVGQGRGDTGEGEPAGR